MNKTVPSLLAILLFLYLQVNSQHACSKWYFGMQRALDFTTTPPTPLNNSAMGQMEGSASVADEAGNLLFYTNGFTIYNAQHTVMANGNGLTGNQSSSQSALIVKQPGNSNLYYVFTVGDSGIDTLAYSIVDMNLAGGSGSVTIKNFTLAVNMVEKLTGTRHCNGIDIWILAHDYNSNNFRSYLLTSAGLNPQAVNSPIGSVHTGTPYAYGGCMKISPTGKKVGVAICAPLNTFELFDFDNTTGVLSNSLSLGTGSLFTWSYGCEFSPDGSKFYGTTWYRLIQWDLCNSPPTAYAVDSFTNFGAVTQLQLAPDGKIYDTKGGFGNTSISVINNPNATGALCNYSVGSQPVNNGSPGLNGGPNFMGSQMRQRAAPLSFSSSVSCNFATFNAPTFTTVGCANSGGYSVTAITWNFGDPVSGPANTSTSSSTSHIYSSAGTYTASLIIQYSCGGGIDTVKQAVLISQTCLSVTPYWVGCNSGQATVASTIGVGPFSYTWLPGPHYGPTVMGIAQGSYTIIVHDANSNTTFTAGTVLQNSSPLQGIVVNGSPSVACIGVPSGSALISGPVPSGSVVYSWNGAAQSTINPINNLAAGSHTVVITHLGLGCSVTRYLTITSPPPVSIGVSALSPSSCAGNSVTFVAMATGGTPGYTYSWTNGPQTNTFNTTEQVSGNYLYTVTATDANSCVMSYAHSHSFMPLPTLTVNNPSICPGTFTLLSVSGASSYSWSTGSAFTSIGVSPSVTTQFTVTGTANTCSSAVVATVHTYPTPTIQFTHNSPVCSGKPLYISASGGATYSWFHPQNSPQVPSFTINSAALGDAGNYQVYVFSTNGCTAIASTSITVNDTPFLVLYASTVCAGETLTLTSQSQNGNSYLWLGPNNFSSQSQNVSIINAPLTASGIYTVLASAPNGCTNSAVVAASVQVLPIANIISNSPLCAGSTLTVNSNGQFWTGPSGFYSPGGNFVINNPTPQASGQYTLLLANGTCTVNSIVNLLVHAVPSLTLIPWQQQRCENSVFSLSVTGSGINNYTWNGPGIQSLSGPHLPVTTASLSHAGVYTVTAVNANSCQSSSTATVQIMAAPVLSISGRTEICANEQTVLFASGADMFLWNSTWGGPSVTLTPAFTQTYSVRGTDVSLCQSVKVFTVTVFDCVGFNAEVSEQPAIRVFPNPTDGMINVIDVQKDDALQVYDATGKLLENIKPAWESSHFQIQMTDLPSALYLIVIKDKNGKVIGSGKILKE